MITIDERTWSQKRPELDRLRYAPEPLDAQTVGKPHDAPLGVYLSYHAAMFIETYLQANPVNEMAGFLVGHALQGSKRPFILITGAIEARDAVQVDSGLRFSQETWAYLKNVWQREYADTVVLGWFHSQPGKGLVLSDVNRFTHQRFFERPWQVSFVVDPLQNTSRFYRRAGKKIVPLEDFYLFDPSENTPPLAVPKEHSDAPEATLGAEENAATAEHEIPPPPPVNSVRRIHRWHGIGIILLLFAVLTFTLTAHRMLLHSPRLQQAAVHLSSIETQLAEARSEQQRLEELILQLKLGANIEQQEQPSIRLPGGTNTLGGTLSPPFDRNEVSDILPTAGDWSGHETDGNFRLYVVKPGDTLWKISENEVGSPYAYSQLAELNQLANPDRILPGMILRLPPTDGQ